MTEYHFLFLINVNDVVCSGITITAKNEEKAMKKFRELHPKKKFLGVYVAKFRETLKCKPTL